MLNRRDFLRQQIGAGTLLAFGATAPGFLASTARAADKQDQEKILVVVELTGGNDGLNTVIPYGDDLYHKARPKLRKAGSPYPQRALWTASIAASAQRDV
jgi:uncharacterized protein (DUF1501 family)